MDGKRVPFSGPGSPPALLSSRPMCHVRFLIHMSRSCSRSRLRSPSAELGLWSCSWQFAVCSFSVAVAAAEDLR